MYRRIVSGLRIRPFSQHELSNNAENCLQSDDTNRVSVMGTNLSIRFDFLLAENLVDMPPNAYFERVYESVGAKLLEDIESGKNVMYLSYGEGGAGKTFTIYGREQQEGLVHFIARELMRRSEGKHISFELEMFELYNEELKDLFDEKAKLVLRMSKDKDKVKMQGITRRNCNTFEEFKTIVQQGRKALAKNYNMMNVLSGRSHVQLNITIKYEEKEQEITFLDLAGSQKIGKVGVSPTVQKEVVSIGKALSCIHQVLTGMSKNKSHIPFRDSKLTYANLDRLINSSLIVMFNVSPASTHKEQTVSTLRFAKQVAEH